LPELSRQLVRAAFERRFTAPRMANDYVSAYDRVMHRKKFCAEPAMEPADAIPIPTADSGEHGVGQSAGPL
jgi:hypothetical protein